MSKSDRQQQQGKRRALALDDALSSQDHLKLRERAMTWSAAHGRAGPSHSLDEMGDSRSGWGGGGGIEGDGKNMFRRNDSAPGGGSNSNLHLDEVRGSAMQKEHPSSSSSSISRSNSVSSSSSAPRIFRSNSDRVKMVVMTESGSNGLKRSGSELLRAKAGFLRHRREQEGVAAGLDGGAGDASYFVADSAEERAKERAHTTNKLKQFWNTTIRRKKKDRSEQGGAIVSSELASGAALKTEFFKPKNVCIYICVCVNVKLKRMHIFEVFQAYKSVNECMLEYESS